MIVKCCDYIYLVQNGSYRKCWDYVPSCLILLLSWLLIFNNYFSKHFSYVFLLWSCSKFLLYFRKACVLGDRSFDFLTNVVAGVPDVQGEDEQANPSLLDGNLSGGELREVQYVLHSIFFLFLEAEFWSVSVKLKYCFFRRSFGFEYYISLKLEVFLYVLNSL